MLPGIYVAAMPAMTSTNEVSSFGAELRRWRQRRRLSQLELANAAEVSQRHLSFLETGRSQPSSEMVEHLGLTLGVSLRGRNALLHAAGYAPTHSEEPLDGAALSTVREGLETLVAAHEPYPAYVVDRCWNLLLANAAAAQLVALLVPGEAGSSLGGNVLRLMLHPDGARSRVANWAHAAGVVVQRFSDECAANPGDAELQALYEEVMGYPDVAELSHQRQTSPGFIAELVITAEPADLKLYTAIASLAGASDLTLAELRLETLLPADSATAETLRSISQGNAPQTQP